MAKQIRIYLTVKEETRSHLEAWADVQGRNLTNLANWLIEKAVNEAIVSGELKLTGPAKNSDSAQSESEVLLNEFLDSIELGSFYSDKEIAILAVQINRSLKSLHKIQACYQKGVVNEK